MRAILIFHPEDQISTTRILSHLSSPKLVSEGKRKMGGFFSALCGRRPAAWDDAEYVDLDTSTQV